ncbi:hypothetical protein LTR95_001440 [Oleoguttula sp. CCFEE 5521]
MVSVSPRLRDSLEYEDPENVDPRMSWGFRSLTLSSAGHSYEDLEYADDERPFSASADPGSARRKRRQRQSDLELSHVESHSYRTVADGDSFRLAVLKPGTGSAPIDIDLIFESSKQPKREYRCLSYCWQATALEYQRRTSGFEALSRVQSLESSVSSIASSTNGVGDAAILVDGYRFSVTTNLLRALRSLRKRNNKILIWVDQICINQEDHVERGHQVSIMKDIFRQASQVIVYLGELPGSEKLVEYAKKSRRGGVEGVKTALKRILPPRQLKDAIQRMLELPWFGRVWVISEVCLAPLVRISFGPETHMSWENLLGLVRDIPVAPSQGFAKSLDLLGNTRQRIAIITQMMAQQKDGAAHADISQLLVLAKSSNATDHRDKIYSFYGMTLLTTTPDYTRSVPGLFIEVICDYVNSIEALYANWKDLSDPSRTLQLMSILYSAGSLHQHYELPSWIPDWTSSWHLAPLWACTTANLNAIPTRNDWAATNRSDFRAGGDRRDNLEITAQVTSSPRLRLSAIVLDHIVATSDTTPASTPAPSPGAKGTAPVSPVTRSLVANGTIRYGRTFFDTQKGFTGLATPGIKSGDVVAILLGGDVPVVLRPLKGGAKAAKLYRLLCECFVESHAVMYGDIAKSEWTRAQDIVLV